MDGSQGRKAANEAVFREVNERIESLQSRHAVSANEPLYLVCECDRLDCTEGIEVQLRIYERIRSDSAQFVVLPGHEDATVENIVDTGPGYLIVRKHPGDAREIARDTDPREE